MSDKEPEVTDYIKQQQDKSTTEVVLQIEKKSAKTNAIFCFDSADKPLPIHNISWTTTEVRTSKAWQKKTKRWQEMQ